MVTYVSVLTRLPHQYVFTVLRSLPNLLEIKMMITLRLYLGTLIIIASAGLAGCSDFLTAPESSSTTHSVNNERAIQSGEFERSGLAVFQNESLISNSENEFLADTLYHYKIGVQPYQTHTFNYYNTGLRRIYSISVSGCDTLSNLLEVVGYMDDQIFSLECEERGICITRIDFRNLTGSILKMEVTLTGTRATNSIITGTKKNY